MVHNPCARFFRASCFLTLGFRSLDYYLTFLPSAFKPGYIYSSFPFAGLQLPPILNTPICFPFFFTIFSHLCKFFSPFFDHDLTIFAHDWLKAIMYISSLMTPGCLGIFAYSIGGAKYWKYIMIQPEPKRLSCLNYHCTRISSSL